MITLNDVNNELHVRLYILEVLKDYIRDDDFDELLDKALDFVMEGVSMPKVPVKDTTMSDISRSIIALTTGIGFDGKINKSPLELAYDRCRMRYVFDPRNRDIHGVVQNASLSTTVMFLRPVIYFGRAFPNWRARVIPAIVISGFLASVSKNPICFSDGSMSIESAT